MSPQRTQSGPAGGAQSPQGGLLPVDLQRLRRQFPQLTAEDVDAYAEVTRRILSASSPDRRARLTREILVRGRQARDKRSAGGALTDDEALAFRYLQAVTKMQDSTVRR